MRCAITVVADAGSSDMSSAATAAEPMAKEIGTPAKSSTANTRARMMASFMRRISIQTTTDNTDRTDKGLR